MNLNKSSLYLNSNGKFAYSCEFTPTLRVTLFYILFLVLIFGCKSRETVIVFTVKPAIFEKPPGTIHLAENLYFDKTEITNSNYLEYVNWTLKHYGKNSTEYKNCLPNTTVWSALNPNYSFLDSIYFRDFVYRDYPVVGVSFAQAELFTNWRTERVAENWLIQTGKIADHGVVPVDSIFTIEKYFTGKYFDYIPDSSIQYLPKYYLPDTFDYKEVIDFSRKQNLKNYKSCRKKYCDEKLLLACNCFGERENRTASYPYGINPTLETYCSFCNKDLITHLQGNVREFTSVEGKVFGNSFVDPSTEDWTQIRIQSSNPNCYTGFRNSCCYESIKQMTTSK